MSEDKKEFRQRLPHVTRRMTVKPCGEKLEVHSTMLGYPITFDLSDELREFLRTL